ncbi:hypothetical protein [Intestinibacter bartlettii]|uniref:hypothetical protein n=1 Tax=Intestinibacter bartlettii TaxID=261299 RepID=UPI0039F55B3B
MNSLFQLVKDKLVITWSDEDTDRKINNLIEDAEIALNHKLGVNLDYSKPGQERRLFLNYCMYMYNNCENEFDSNYINEIYQLRHKYEVFKYEQRF